jgi:hypothetical protein
MFLRRPTSRRNGCPRPGRSTLRKQVLRRRGCDGFWWRPSGDNAGGPIGLLLQEPPVQRSYDANRCCCVTSTRADHRVVRHGFPLWQCTHDSQNWIARPSEQTTETASGSTLIQKIELLLVDHLSQDVLQYYRLQKWRQKKVGEITCSFQNLDRGRNLWSVLCSILLCLSETWLYLFWKVLIQKSNSNIFGTHSYLLSKLLLFVSWRHQPRNDTTNLRCRSNLQTIFF